MLDLGIDLAAELFGLHVERGRGKAHGQPGAVHVIGGEVAAHVHDIGRGQPGAQDGARLLEEGGVQQVFVQVQQVGRLLQAERPALERAAQAFLLGAHGDGVPI